MKRIKRIVATVGEYTDREGNQKKRYATIGTLLERDNGSQSIKIENIPVGWNGWASFYDFDEKREAGDTKRADSIDDEISF